MNNKKSNLENFNRLVGMNNPKKREKAEKEWQERQERYVKEIKKHELAPSSEHLKVFRLIIDAVGDYLKKYDIQPRKISTENIHLVEPGSINKIAENISVAMHSVIEQKIALEIQDTDIQLANLLCHELLHYQSYKAIQIDKEGDLAPYRSGISISDRKGYLKCFKALEEAIVAEANKQIFEELTKSNKSFQEELALTNQVKDWLRNFFNRNKVSKEEQNAFLDEVFFVPNGEEMLILLHSDIKDAIDEKDSDMQKFASFLGYMDGSAESGSNNFLERQEERQRFYNLVDEIIEKSKGKFKARTEVFEIFARANFSGNLMPFARVIEKTLGRGSFKKIAEKF